MKARDFYQRVDKKTGRVLSTRGLGTNYTRQALETYWQKQLIKQEQLDEQQDYAPHSHKRKEVDIYGRTDVQSEQLEKLKTIARDAQSRANQQQIARQINLRQLNAETKEYEQRVKRQNRQAARNRSNQKRPDPISKQRRANEAAKRKLEELKRVKRNNHEKDVGPDL